MSDLLTIEAVESAFSQWRESRHCQEPIPANLLDQVKQLLLHYKPSVVSRRLKMSSKQLKKLMEPLPLPNSGENTLSRQHFAQAVFSSSFAPSAVKKSVNIVVSGRQKQMVLKLNQADLPTVLTLLMEKL